MATILVIDDEDSIRHLLKGPSKEECEPLQRVSIVSFKRDEKNIVVLQCSPSTSQMRPAQLATLITNIDRHPGYLLHHRTGAWVFEKENW